ncbi:DUF4381 domain-containing protein [Pseudidiomarina sp.]|uniref:DUF4381 domain-containing protein n=1 Tax=Pseudidiomarina sp. TaxID=2081707 RepID=UPI00299DC01D|nr:DUF4381 domain-containing protein [Pseudidiomarina sp.]MDX1705032.1 DUF4381 domain-containing protein [Pseudidiomarina sp.]
MMDQPSALHELNDIITPPPADWWPLAPGWYLVAALAITVLVVTILLVIRRQRRRRVRNAALQHLRQQPPTSIPAVTLLLKQALLGYFPANRVAAISGADWWEFLVRQLPPRRRVTATTLLQQVKQQNFKNPTSDTPEYHAAVASYRQFARYWLRRALPPRRSSNHD